MDAHHETSDVEARGIVGFAVGLVLTGIAIHLAVSLLFGYFTAREAARAPSQFPLAAGRASQTPPEPRLQTNPRQDLLDLRAAEDAVLRSYGWVDKKAGVVRIPIDEAMKLTVKRGLPSRGAGK
jgi:hypothetical protein